MQNHILNDQNYEHQQIQSNFIDSKKTKMTFLLSIIMVLFLFIGLTILLINQVELQTLFTTYQNSLEKVAFNNQHQDNQLQNHQSQNHQPQKQQPFHNQIQNSNHYNNQFQDNEEISKISYDQIDYNEIDDWEFSKLKQIFKDQQKMPFFYKNHRNNKNNRDKKRSDSNLRSSELHDRLLLRTDRLLLQKDRLLLKTDRLLMEGKQVSGDSSTSASASSPSSQSDISTSASASSPSSQSMILIIMASIFVGVPILVLLFLLLVTIYIKCTTPSPLHNPQNQRSFSNAQEQARYNARDGIIITQYNLNQIKPYRINLGDTCVICLDERVNVRTNCTHLFHANCLRTWFHKEKIVNRKQTCPVCVSQTTNPATLYCNFCSGVGKFIKISAFTSKETLKQVQQFKCNDCQSGTDNIESNSTLTNKKDVPQRVTQQLQTGNSIQIHIHHDNI